LIGGTEKISKGGELILFFFEESLETTYKINILFTFFFSHQQNEIEKKTWKKFHVHLRTKVIKKIAKVKNNHYFDINKCGV
jgi:hypothetical protein